MIGVGCIRIHKPRGERASRSPARRLVARQAISSSRLWKFGERPAAHASSDRARNGRGPRGPWPVVHASRRSTDRSIA